MVNIKKGQSSKYSSQLTERPFLIGDTIYNTEDLYLHETAGYGGKTSLLSKNTISVVKKYHYNNGLYIALGEENTYYDIAWTNEFNKFIKEPPQEDISNIEISNTENSNDYETKEITEETKKENLILRLFNKTKKFIEKLFEEED